MGTPASDSWSGRNRAGPSGSRPSRSCSASLWREGYEKEAREAGLQQEGLPYTPTHPPWPMASMSTHVIPEETNFLRPSRVCWAK